MMKIDLAYEAGHKRLKKDKLPCFRIRVSWLRLLFAFEALAGYFLQFFIFYEARPLYSVGPFFLESSRRYSVVRFRVVEKFPVEKAGVQLLNDKPER